MVDRWGTGRWREDLDSKTTLQIYRNMAGIGSGICIGLCLGSAHSGAELIL